MPVHHAIWRIGENPQPLTISKLASEQLLEKMILNDPTILSDQWMIIGHQENTLDKGRIDLLAIAPDASLILIELKRDRTPREVVAQALDYASWVDDLSAERLSQIYDNFPVEGTWVTHSDNDSTPSWKMIPSTSRIKLSLWLRSWIPPPNVSSII